MNYLDNTSLGGSAKSDFRLAKPFPHIVIENFIPLSLVRAIRQEWPEHGWRVHEHAHSLKRGNPHMSSFGPNTRKLIEDLNSPQTVNSLAWLTDIDNLAPDSALAGGGLHETFRDGFLGVHADFNFHPTTRMHRRINLLLYLNEGWQHAWCGELELWDKNGWQKRIPPVAGRCVIFETTDTSLHGQPDKLRCPNGESRKSLALYYYSPDRPEQEVSQEHSTLYVGAA